MPRLVITRAKKFSTETRSKVGFQTQYYHGSMLLLSVFCCAGNFNRQD